MTARALDALARGVLAGEAMAWPTGSFRLRLFPPRRLARMEVLAAFAREHGTTTPAVPYAHSSPVATLQPGAGECSEWFAFTARSQTGPGSPEAAWRALAESGAGAVRIGTRVPLDNLRRGLAAPASGNDNPHYFDDLPMLRAVAVVAAHATESARREAALADAAVTAALDGLWCAEATAVLFSRLREGEGPRAATDAALAVLPDPSWSRRLAESALRIADEATGTLDLAQRLAVEVGDVIYSYGAVAPETLALLLAHTRAADSPDRLMLGALAHPRSAATLPALAGAAAVLRFGEDWIPDALTTELPLTGIAVPGLAGVPIREALAGV